MFVNVSDFNTKTGNPCKETHRKYEILENPSEDVIAEYIFSKLIEVNINARC